MWFIARNCYKCVICSCSGCGSEVSREDSFYELLLNICGHKELSECLKEFFQVSLFIFQFLFRLIKLSYYAPPGRSLRIGYYHLSVCLLVSSSFNKCTSQFRFEMMKYLIGIIRPHTALSLNVL